MIEMTKDYLMNMGRDPNSFVTLIRTELEGMGIIDGGDSMIYKDPDSTYTFKIDRVGNDYVIPGGPEYTCIISILNDVGVTITEIRFSEFDCVKIIGNIAEWIEEVFEFGISDPFITHIGFDTTRVNTLIEISVNEYDLKPFTLKFKQFNPHIGIMSDISTIFLEYEELVDFCFRIFFACIIDLDYSVFYQKGLEKELAYLESFVIDENCTYIRTPNGYYDVPKEFDPVFTNTLQNQQIQSSPCTYTGNPEFQPYLTLPPPSDAEISYLRTSNKRKNTVLGLYSTKNRRNQNGRK